MNFQSFDSITRDCREMEMQATSFSAKHPRIALIYEHHIKVLKIQNEVIRPICSRDFT